MDCITLTYFTEFQGHFPYLDLAKIRDTVHLI